MPESDHDPFDQLLERFQAEDAQAKPAQSPPADLSAEVQLPVPPARVPASEVGTPAPAAQPPEDLVLVARYPHEMQACQQQLIDWAARKIAATQLEVDDLAENIDIAVRQNWGRSALVRVHARTVKLVAYYTNVKLALEQGYCIVPNFPVKVFAVRTKRKTPSDTRAVGKYERPASHEAEGLPAGAGRWVDNDPLSRTETCTMQDSQGRPYERTVLVPTALATEIDFPFVLAKPEVLLATERAIVAKVFDDLGVLPARPKKDPIVVGRILDPRSTSHARRYLTFLVAWFVDVRTL